jgi:16S rRNA (adenine1518-N6/adenine1519-N6)-dimethyltransferase
MRMSRYNNKSIREEGSAEGGKKKYGRGKPSRPSGGVWAKKALGQHFLKDESIAMDIVDALLIPYTKEDEIAYEKGEPYKEQVNVLEIGPGTGVLTKYLLENKKIKLEVAEIDDESIAFLKSKFPQLLYTLQKRDFLTIDPHDIFQGQFFIIGNFPYNISSQIFFKILEYRDSVPQVVCMLQKEVAERLASGPGNKSYGILSVLLQAWYNIEYLFTVDNTVFMPRPKVQSAVIRLIRNERTSLGCDEELFKAIIKTCFNQRRKTIRNSIKPLLNTLPTSIAPSAADLNSTDQNSVAGASPDSILQRLESTCLLDSRPEQLGVEDFVKLAKAVR